MVRAFGISILALKGTPALDAPNQTIIKIYSYIYIYIHTYIHTYSCTIYIYTYTLYVGL